MVLHTYCTFQWPMVLWYCGAIYIYMYGLTCMYSKKFKNFFFWTESFFAHCFNQCSIDKRTGVCYFCCRTPTLLMLTACKDVHCPKNGGGITEGFLTLFVTSIV